MKGVFQMGKNGDFFVFQD